VTAPEKRAFLDELQGAWGGLGGDQKALLGLGGGLAGGALLHSLLGGGGGTDALMGAGGLGAAGLALWPQIQQAIGNWSSQKPPLISATGEPNAPESQESHGAIPMRSTSGAFGPSDSQTAPTDARRPDVTGGLDKVGPATNKPYTPATAANTGLSMADAAKHPELGRYFSPDGSPNAQALIQAPDEELQQRIGLLSPEAKNQLRTQLASFQPSFGQRIGAKAMGIDIDAQKNRFGELLKTAALLKLSLKMFGKEKEEDESLLKRTGKNIGAYTAGALLPTAAAQGYVKSLGGVDALMNRGVHMDRAEAQTLQKHMGLDPSRVHHEMNPNLPAHFRTPEMHMSEAEPLPKGSTKIHSIINTPHPMPTDIEARSDLRMRKILARDGKGPPVPETAAAGVTAHELGHAKTFEKMRNVFGNRSNKINAMMYPGGMAGMGIGTLVAALTDPGSTAHNIATYGGTASMMPMLAHEMSASHLGGMGLLKHYRPQGMMSRAGTYLSAYRGLPTYALAATSPLVTSGVKHWMNRNKEAAARLGIYVDLDAEATSNRPFEKAADPHRVLPFKMPWDKDEELSTAQQLGFGAAGVGGLGSAGLMAGSAASNMVHSNLQLGTIMWSDPANVQQLARELKIPMAEAQQLHRLAASNPKAFQAKLLADDRLRSGTFRMKSVFAPSLGDIAVHSNVTGGPQLPPRSQQLLTGGQWHHTDVAANSGGKPAYYGVGANKGQPNLVGYFSDYTASPENYGLVQLRSKAPIDQKAMQQHLSEETAKLKGQAAPNYGHSTTGRLGLREAFPEMNVGEGSLVHKALGTKPAQKLLGRTLGADSDITKSLSSDCQGDICTTWATKGHAKQYPDLYGGKSLATASPNALVRQAGKKFQVAGMHLPEAAATREALQRQHLMRFGQLGVRAPLILGGLGLGAYGTYRALENKQHD
jgi:hypothetical protein